MTNTNFRGNAPDLRKHAISASYPLVGGAKSETFPRHDDRREQVVRSDTQQGARP